LVVDVCGRGRKGERATLGPLSAAAQRRERSERGRAARERGERAAAAAQGGEDDATRTKN